MLRTGKVAGLMMFFLIHACKPIFYFFIIVLCLSVVILNKFHQTNALINNRWSYVREIRRMG